MRPPYRARRPELPALPVAYARALAVSADDEAPVSTLAAIIEGDPALTAAVLRIANSAASAPLRRIGTANDAILRVGLLATRRVITGVAMGRRFTNLAAAGIDADETWRHLVTSALIADATAWPGGPRTEAFTAGLLHDIGRLALATDDPPRYRATIERSAHGEPIEEAERDAFGVDHAEWGAEVGRLWQFPDAVVQAIHDHHAGETSSLAWVTQHGREMARALGVGDGVRPPSDPVAVTAPDDQELIAGMGGRERLLARVDWYRSALQAA